MLHVFMSISDVILLGCLINNKTISTLYEIHTCYNGDTWLPG